LKNSSCWIVWDKDNGENSFADCELAWTSFDSAVRKFRYRWCGFQQGLTCQPVEKRLHPTQKPIGLCEWFIKKYLDDKKEGLIADLFLGSGSTLIASQKTGRVCFGMELCESYVDVIIQRYVDYTGNTKVIKDGKEIEWKR